MAVLTFNLITYFSSDTVGHAVEAWTLNSTTGCGASLNPIGGAIFGRVLDQSREEFDSH